MVGLTTLEKDEQVTRWVELLQLKRLEKPAQVAPVFGGRGNRAE